MVAVFLYSVDVLSQAIASLCFIICRARAAAEGVLKKSLRMGVPSCNLQAVPHADLGVCRQAPSAAQVYNPLNMYWDVQRRDKPSFSCLMTGIQSCPNFNGWNDDAVTRFWRSRAPEEDFTCLLWTIPSAHLWPFGRQNKQKTFESPVPLLAVTQYWILESPNFSFLSSTLFRTGVSSSLSTRHFACPTKIARRVVPRSSGGEIEKEKKRENRRRQWINGFLSRLAFARGAHAQLG